MTLAARALGVFLGILILGQAQPASADYPYNGSGQWTTSSLGYYFYGPDSSYKDPTDMAAYDWSSLTDLTVNATAEGYEKIGVNTGAYGSGAFNGRTTICVVAGGCSSVVPINSNYSYAQIDLNTSNTSGWSWGLKRALAAHELGHAFSLWHSPYCEPDHIMYGGGIQHSCNGGLQFPDSHAITGINWRY